MNKFVKGLTRSFCFVNSLKETFKFSTFREHFQFSIFRPLSFLAISKTSFLFFQPISLKERLCAFLTALGHLELTYEHTHKFVISSSRKVSMAKLGEFVPKVDVSPNHGPVGFGLIFGANVVFSSNQK